MGSTETNTAQPEKSGQKRWYQWRGWSRRRKIVLTSSLVVVAHVVGALTSVHAVMTPRSSQGAVAWVIGLNTMPWVAVPAYWIVGQSKFDGYVTAHRAAIEKTINIPPAIRQQVIDKELRTDPDGAVQAVERLSTLPYTMGNEAQLLVDGAATFAAIEQAIDAAEDYILFQFYIVRDDALGQRLRDRLVKKAREGIRVYFLYDGIGSHALGEAYTESLREAGVEVAVFSTAGRGVNTLQINFRNHRKVVVVDGKVAFVGGLNVGNEYLGITDAFKGWRDTHIRLRGPAALGAQLSFTEDWQFAHEELLQLSWDPQPAVRPGVPAMVIPSGPADNVETAKLLFVHAINSATERIWIATPYFVPDEAVTSALQLAAMRGVDVRIILPDNNDSTLVWLAAFSYFDESMPLGVKFYKYTEGFLHSKVMLVDQHTAVVGSANMDNRSFRLNFEISAVVVDPDFAGEVQAMLEEDFRRSRPVAEDAYASRPFWFRLAVSLARLTAPVL